MKTQILLNRNLDPQSSLLKGLLVLMTIWTALQSLATPMPPHSNSNSNSNIKSNTSPLPPLPKPQALWELFYKEALAPVLHGRDTRFTEFKIIKDDQGQEFYEISTIGYRNDPELLTRQKKDPKSPDNFIGSIYHISLSNNKFEPIRLSPLVKDKAPIAFDTPHLVQRGSLNISIGDLTSGDSRWESVQAALRGLFRADPWLHPYSNLRLQHNSNNSPEMVLSAPQQEALDQLMTIEYEMRQDKTQFKATALTMPVGTGKTLVTLRYLQKLHEENLLNRPTKIVVVYENLMALQQMQKFLKTQLKIKDDEIINLSGNRQQALNSMKRAFNSGSFKAILATRSSYFSHMEHIHPFIEANPKLSWFYFFDEAHHLGTQAGQFDNILNGYKDIKGLTDLLDGNDRMFAVSATFWHQDNLLVSHIAEGRVAAPFLTPEQIKQLRESSFTQSKQSTQLLVQDLALKQLAEAIRQGYLSPLSKFEVNQYIGNKTVSEILRDTETATSEEHLTRQLQIHQGVVDHMAKRIMAHREPHTWDHGLVFVPTIHHANLYAALLNKYFQKNQIKGTFRSYHSELNREQRDELENWFIAADGNSHKYWVVVDAVRESIDVPMVNLILNARSIHEFRNLVQIYGRGSRPFIGKSGLRLIDMTTSFLHLLKPIGAHEILVEGEKITEFQPLPTTAPLVPKIRDDIVKSNDFVPQNIDFQDQLKATQDLASLEAKKEPAKKTTISPVNSKEKETQDSGLSLLLKIFDTHKKIEEIQKLIKDRQESVGEALDTDKNNLAIRKKINERLNLLNKNLFELNKELQNKKWTYQMWTEYLNNLKQNGPKRYPLDLVDWSIGLDNSMDPRFPLYILNEILEETDNDKRENFTHFWFSKQIDLFPNREYYSSSVEKYDFFSTLRSALSSFNFQKIYYSKYHHIKVSFLESLTNWAKQNPGEAKALRNRIHNFVFNIDGSQTLTRNVNRHNGESDLALLHFIYNKLFPPSTPEEIDFLIKVLLHQLKSNKYFPGGYTIDMSFLEDSLTQVPGPWPNIAFTEEVTKYLLSRADINPQIILKALDQWDIWKSLVPSVEDQLLNTMLSSLNLMKAVNDKYLKEGGIPSFYLKIGSLFFTEDMSNNNFTYYRWLKAFAHLDEIPIEVIETIKESFKLYPNWITESQKKGTYRESQFYPLSYLLDSLLLKEDRAYQKLLPQLWPLFDEALNLPYDISQRALVTRLSSILIMRQNKGLDYPLELARKVDYFLIHMKLPQGNNKAPESTELVDYRNWLAGNFKYSQDDIRSLLSKHVSLNLLTEPVGTSWIKKRAGIVKGTHPTLTSSCDQTLRPKKP